MQRAIVLTSDDDASYATYGTGDDYACPRKVAAMSEKSPRKTDTKKPGKTIKEKRQAKKDKAKSETGLHVAR